MQMISRPIQPPPLLPGPSLIKGFLSLFKICTAAREDAARRLPLLTSKDTEQRFYCSVLARKPSLVQSNTEILQFRRLLWSRPLENKAGTDRQGADQSEYLHFDTKGFY